MIRSFCFIIVFIVATVGSVASGQVPSNFPSQPDRVFPCEFMKAAIDVSIIENSKLKDAHLIFLLRPGLKERFSKLSRKRIKALRACLDNRRFRQDNIIFATSEARDEYASIEIYSKGILSYRVYLRYKGNVNFVC